MLYSIKFLLFIAALLFIYYIIPRKWRWLVLLIGSYTFYAIKGRFYLLYLIFTTLFSFFIAKKIENAGKDKKRKKLLVALLVTVLSLVLFLFKLQPLREHFSLLLPIGISYYTFMVIGYIVDVYRKRHPAEQNLLHYALFVGYFPGLIQGPINRFDEMRKQFFEEHPFSFATIRNGFWLFLWGLFKKLVIADRCAVYVGNVINENLTDKPGSLILMGIILFVVQMYGDFSGGIDMAEGISEMFGISMYQNFRQPFFSASIGEFWRRWHMSLGNWIKDYVFYPIAFSKRYRKISMAIGKKNAHLGKKLPAMFVSIFTFFIIGIWHDCNLTYVCYGLWYGTLVGASEVLEPVFKKCADFLLIKTDCFSYRMFQRFRTWLIVLIGESLCILPGISFFKPMVVKICTDFRYYECFFGLFEQGLNRLDFFLLLISLIIWILVSNLKERGIALREAIASQNIWCHLGLTCGVILFIALFGIYGPGYDAAAFIYAGI